MKAAEEKLNPFREKRKDFVKQYAGPHYGEGYDGRLPLPLMFSLAQTLVPMVAVLMQLLKKMKVMEKLTQYLPFISIGVAYLLATVMKMPDPIMPSIIIGLVADGSYDVIKGISGK